MVKSRRKVWYAQNATRQQDRAGQGRVGQATASLLVVLLLSTSHTLIPASLSNTCLIVRRNRLDVLHDALDGGSRLVAVAVHYTLSVITFDCTVRHVNRDLQARCRKTVRPAKTRL